VLVPCGLHSRAGTRNLDVNARCFAKNSRMSSFAQYSPWHKAYADCAGAVKESAGESDKKPETEGKANKVAGNMQKAVGGLKDAVYLNTWTTPRSDRPTSRSISNLT
jgi:uncharacterized protein YjbJ (UPF0337 family)